LRYLVYIVFSGHKHVFDNKIIIINYLVQLTIYCRMIFLSSKTKISPIIYSRMFLS